MATLKTKWLLSIWVVSLSKCFASAGPPAPPSRPVCYIPCDENCQVDIHCTWEPGQDPLTDVEYTLHWEPARSEHPHVAYGPSLNGLIDRQHFSSHEDLRVWVQAKNQHGSAKSEVAEFNTADIFKPSPPKVTSSQREPLEIHWTSICDPLYSSGLCDLQYRNEADKEWHLEISLHGSYTLVNPRPCTVYEFQVRCSCYMGLTSDWSAVHRIVSTEGAPVGKLDVWMDCGISPKRSDCVLTWKKFPLSQSCALILGYEVRLFYGASPAVLVNMSTAEPSGLLVSEEMQCHFNSSLKDVSSVSVSAYNLHGASVPSYLSLPLAGKEKNEQYIDLRMTEQNLTVSWKKLYPHPDDLKEYVVQYKQVGLPLGRGFVWVKVNKNQTATFEGQFQKYTPYQVSLFTLSHSNQVRYLSSAVGYSVEGPPPKLPSFKVVSITATQINLSWTPIPLLNQNGTILYYQIGVDGHNVYNASTLKTAKLLKLSPGQKYKVWIRAVTAAGPGENSTLTLETHFSEHLKPILLGSVLVAVCISVVLVCALQGGKKKCPLMAPCFCEKVPDPRNSLIFNQVKNQMNDPMGWICIPVREPHPQISLLEVVEIPSWAFKSCLEKTSDPGGLKKPVVSSRCSQMDGVDSQREDAVTEECHKTDNKFGKEEYSKIVDSDEEEEEDCWNSSTEEPYKSGYEKHFMPSALEILEVS